METAESILDYADSVEVNNVFITPADITDDSVKAGLLDFAPVEDIVFMMNHFGVSKENMFSSDTLSIMQYLSSTAKNMDIPLQEFIFNIGAKVGGKFSPNFLQKVYAYMSLATEEMHTIRKLQAIRAEKETYVENSNYL